MLMDEPFGALDPITRTRLQKELLRIQREIRKTIIFVTHDIDEAILIGDRIAILREGGVLAQYDTPEELLAHPADEFVARFVGADRGLKRLSLTRLGELELEPANGAVGPLLDADTTLRDALSAMLNDGARAVVVEGGDGTKRVLTLDRLTELLALDGRRARSSPTSARRATASRRTAPSAPTGCARTGIRCCSRRSSSTSS